MRWVPFLCVCFFVVGCGGSDTDAAPDIRLWGGATPGTTDGPPDVARFSNPANVAVGSDGTAYVADFDNDAVRRIGTDGVVSTLVRRSDFRRPFGLAVSGGLLFVQTDGNDRGERDATTGTVWSVDLGTGAVRVIARNLGRPRGLAALADGRIALSDPVRSTVSLLSRDGTVAPLAGSDGAPGFADGAGGSARFSGPYGVAVAPDGALLVADQGNGRLRRVGLDGTVSTVAAGFVAPQSVAARGDGTVYVGDHGDFRVKRVRGGAVDVALGSGVQGFTEGEGTAVSFFGLEGIALAPDGRVWVADGNNGDGGPYHRVRRLPVP